MKPPVFEYVSVRSVDEAIAALGRYDGGAKLLAGGQSLVPTLNFRLAHPKALVDINDIPELDGIRAEKGGIRIGALTRHVVVEESEDVRRRFPVLAVAAREVGHLAIRNRGTFGGSLAHNDPAAEFPMVALLLNAKMSLKGPSGGRTVEAKDFFVGFLSTAMEENEILTEVEIPDLPEGTGWGFQELCRRPGDFAIAAVGATVTLEGRECSEARISIAGVGPGPLRVSRAEDIMRGRTLDDALLEKVGEAAREASDPSNDLHGSAEFRRHVVQVLARRVLKEAWDRAARS